MVKKTIFFVGNKRSGTSLLVRLLNRHPDIFIVHEAEILWILYHQTNEIPVKPQKNDLIYTGLKYTLKTCSDIINSEDSVCNRFEKIHRRLMKKGSPWLKPIDKTPQVIGDKQPNTQLGIMDFTEKHFPNSYYLHCVRHPADFVESAWGFRKKLNYGGKTKSVFKWWLKYENMAKDLNVNKHTVKYKDLCNSSKDTLNKVFDWLNVERLDINIPMKPKVYKTRKSIKDKETLRLVKEYGL